MEKYIKKTKVDILLSAWVLLLFLGALFLRMAWKFNYHFDNYMLNQYSELSKQSYAYYKGDISVDDYYEILVYHHDTISNYLEKEANSRSDYRYLINDLKDHILSTMQMINVGKLYTEDGFFEFQYYQSYINSFSFYKYLGIGSSSIGTILLIAWVTNLIIKKKKRDNN